TLSPDHSSLTFAAKEDLNNHWIVAITLDLARDWTWNDVQPVSFEIHRTKQFKRDAEIDDNGGRPVGDLEAIRTASILALQNPNRERTTLIFLDAVEPKSELKQAADPSETRFPDVIELDYTITPFFTSPPAKQDAPGAFTLHLELPVTTPPFDAPRIASA